MSQGYFEYTKRLFDTTRIFDKPEATFWQNSSLGFFPENHSKYHIGIDLHAELKAWAADLTSKQILDQVQDYMLNKRGPGTVATARLNRPADTLAEPHWWERGVFQKVEDVPDATQDQVGLSAGGG